MGGEGTVASLGKGVRSALDRVAEIRKKTPKPATVSGASALPPTSTIDAAKLEGVLGVKGQAKDGMFKATIGRKATASCGCQIGKTMGLEYLAGVRGHGRRRRRGRRLRGHGERAPASRRCAAMASTSWRSITMPGEAPRVLFLRYWGRGKAVNLATTIKNAIDLTGGRQEHLS